MDTMFRTMVVGLPGRRLVSLLVVCILLAGVAHFSIGDAKASASATSYSLPRVPPGASHLLSVLMST